MIQHNVMQISQDKNYPRVPLYSKSIKTIFIDLETYQTTTGYPLIINYLLVALINDKLN
jgi:hypothetical protein